MMHFKWSRYSVLLLVQWSRGSLWTLIQKSTFPNEFGGEMRATDKVIQKNQNTEKNWKLDIQLQNGGGGTISISRHKISDQKWEITFPKEFFLEIWLIIEDCKYNYTAEIKFEKKLFGCAFMGKTNFEQRPKNANLC